MEPCTGKTSHTERIPSSPQAVLCSYAAAQAYDEKAQLAAEAEDLSTATIMFQAANTAWKHAKLMPEDELAKDAAQLAHLPDRHDYLDLASLAAFRLGQLLLEHEQSEAAIEALKEAAELAKKSNQFSPDEIAQLHTMLGGQLAKAQYPQDAIEAVREAIRIRRIDPYYSALDVCQDLCLIAQLQPNASTAPEHLQVIDEVVEEIDSCVPQERTELIKELLPYIESLISTGHTTIAGSIIDRLWKLRDEIGAEADDFFPALATTKSSCLMTEGKGTEALSLCQQALNWLEERRGPEAESTLNARAVLASLYSECEKPHLAERLISTNLQIVRSNREKFSPEYELDLLLELADLCLQSMKYSEAEDHIKTATTLVSDHDSLSWARLVLMRACIRKRSAGPDPVEIGALILEAKLILEKMPSSPNRDELLKNTLIEQASNYCKRRKFRLAARASDELSLLAAATNSRLAEDEAFLVRVFVHYANGTLPSVKAPLIERLQSLPRDCPATTRVAFLFYTGVAEQEEQNHAAAIEYLESARSILNTSFEHPHPNILGVLQALIESYNAIGNTDKVEECLARYETLLGQLNLLNDGEYFPFS